MMILLRYKRYIRFPFLHSTMYQLVWVGDRARINRIAIAISNLLYRDQVLLGKRPLYLDLV